MPSSRRTRIVPVALLACAACGSAPRSNADAPDAERPDSPAVQAEPRSPAAAAPARTDSAAQEVRSVRTSLREADCTTVSVDEEAGGSTQRWPGTAGFALMALDGDARMSITVLDPSGREHPLEFWTSVTGGFSSLGDEAEWRVRGEGASAVPLALIVLLKAHEHPDDPERLTPYRVVAKITPAETCVTHRVPASTPDAEVRRLADASAAQPCRTSYE
ncbi:MAG TPA: hypothetical protein VF142_04130 [Longimicrobium sp.]